MSRTVKTGLDYFSHDVNSLTDKNLRLLKAVYGLTGYAVYFLLLEDIYREGYFIKINEEYNILFSDEHKLDLNVYIKILNDCIKFNLFDKELYEKYSILTSKRVQKNYLDATQRRKNVEIDVNILLLDVSILPENVNINKQIEKESKKKEKKESNKEVTESDKKEKSETKFNRYNFIKEYFGDLYTSELEEAIKDHMIVRD